MINIEILGKFFDNHSLSIINRQIAFQLNKCKDFNLCITPLDNINPDYQIDKNVIKKLKTLAQNELKQEADIQLRHSYPPIWNWPASKKTKVIYIQPWEFPKVPFEWQYKFEAFADTLCVPSNYERDIFITGGMNPDKIFTVPNGYDETIFNLDPYWKSYPGLDPNKYNFVFVGNGQWRKGVDILLNAWKDAVAKYDNCAIIIKDNPSVYGVNNLLNEIIKLQYKSGCADIIYLDDNLSAEQMASIYKVSKFIIHPYRAEGFGMHIQEAVACGCFPFLPNKGPHDEFIPKDVGIRIETQSKMVDITNPEMFALKPGDATTLMSTHTFINEPVMEHLKGAIQHIYHHHEKDKYIDKVKEVKLENTWTNVCAKYEEIIKNVAKRVGTQRDHIR